MFYWIREHIFIHFRKPLEKVRNRIPFIDVAFLYLETHLYDRETLSVLPLISVEEYCKRFAQEYDIIEPSTERPVCQGECFERREQNITMEYAPDIYIATLQQVQMIGQCGVIIGNGYGMLDMLCREDSDRFFYQHLSLIRIYRKHIALKYHKSDEVIPEAISLIGFAPFNYYHATVEILSRLAYMDQKPEYRTLPVLVDQAMLEIKQLKELLDMINVYQHPIMPIKPDTMYTIEKMYYPSLNAWFPMNQKIRNDYYPRDFVIAQSCVDNIRNAVLPNIKTVDTPKRVFISRKNTTRQRLENEKEIINIFSEYGFRVIYPEEMTLSEQIMTFHQAEYIAGATGAAMTNAIYAGKQTIIICIEPMEHKDMLFSELADLSDARLVYMDAIITYEDPLPALDRFRVEVNYCKRFVDNIIK